MGDAHKLEVAQFPTSGVQADYPAQFIVRKNGAVGQLDAKVFTHNNIIMYYNYSLDQRIDIIIIVIGRLKYLYFWFLPTSLLRDYHNTL
jgi:hypothetical protein